MIKNDLYIMGRPPPNLLPQEHRGLTNCVEKKSSLKKWVGPTSGDFQGLV